MTDKGTKYLQYTYSIAHWLYESSPKMSDIYLEQEPRKCFRWTDIWNYREALLIEMNRFLKLIIVEAKCKFNKFIFWALLINLVKVLNLRTNVQCIQYLMSFNSLTLFLLLIYEEILYDYIIFEFYDSGYLKYSIICLPRQYLV